MKFILKIDMKNYPDPDERGEEIAKILGDVKKLVEEGYTSAPQVYDTSGRFVGIWAIYSKEGNVP